MVACSKGGSERASPAAGRATTAAVPLAISLAETAAPAPPREQPICRALRVEGEARLGEVLLTSGAELDGSDWVKLAAGASLTLKHSSSGREVAVAGPAVFRACLRGREQVLLASGKVSAGSGMGARPGAEVLVATPWVGVRYADADFSLVLDGKQLRVEVRTGQVELDAAASLSKSFKSPLQAGKKLLLPLSQPDLRVLMARCQSAAEAAEASARRIADRAAPEALGERAQAHVKARRLARSACTSAAAATGLVADTADAARLWAEVTRWEGLWETIPRRGGAQASEK